VGIIVGATALVTHVIHVNSLAYVAMPSLVIVTLVLSLRHARNAR
jgi:hypothetical protein